MTQDPLPEPSLAEIMAGFSKKNKDTLDENKTLKKKKNGKEGENSLKEAFSVNQIEIEKETEKKVKMELKEENKEEKKEVEKAVESSDDDDDDDDDVVYTGKIIIIPKKQK
jgi:hypothetical protein